MRICDDGHDEVVYGGNNTNCPVCAVICETEDEILALKEQVAELEENIVDLKDKLEDKEDA